MQEASTGFLHLQGCFSALVQRRCCLQFNHSGKWFKLQKSLFNVAMGEKPPTKLEVACSFWMFPFHFMERFTSTVLIETC